MKRQLPPEDYVAISTKKCVVCTKEFSDGGILLDRKLRSLKGKSTLLGWGMCPTCEAPIKEGFVHLVAVDPTKTPTKGDKLHDPADAYRTGRIVTIKREAFEEIFNVPAPERGMGFAEDAVVDGLEEIADRIERANGPNNQEEKLGVEIAGGKGGADSGNDNGESPERIID